MTFKAIVQSIPAWLSAKGPESTVVISSRTRLARNVKGAPYAHRADNELLGDIVQQVLDAAPVAGFSTDSFFTNSKLSDSRKNVFIERHLISQALAVKKGNRGVLVHDGEDSSVLVNEEDHLRIQSFVSGFDPASALKVVDRLHNRFERTIEFAFSDSYGYLTACPTNMGTGLRASVLIHLPALVLTGEVQRVVRSASQLGLAIRGFHGEGSDVVGNLFQISNQRSLGRTEEEIVDSLVQLVKRIIEYETQAADTMLTEARSQTEDKIWRSLGILKTARMLSTGEFMNLSSAARLGILLGYIDDGYLPVINELLVLTQPAHIQELMGIEADPLERDSARATLVRERFVDVKL